MNFLKTFAITMAVCALSMAAGGSAYAKPPSKKNQSLEPVEKKESVSQPTSAQEGHGGGGVKKDGTYMTFYTAGLYVEPTETIDLPTKIPALGILANYISHLSVLSDASKMPLLNAIIPTSSRKYFVATPQSLTPEIKTRLLEEFSRISNIDASHLELYALTDTTTKTTFILPEFFQLSTDDQVAILYHEAYWIIHPNNTYNQVVDAEMAFEAAYKDPSNPARVYDFLKYVGASNEIFKGVLRWELSSGNLNGFLKSENTFTLEDLLGADFFNCAEKNNGQYFDTNYRLNIATVIRNDNPCFPYFRMRLNLLREQYPKSLFFRSIVSRADQGSDKANINMGYAERINGEIVKQLYLQSWLYNSLKPAGYLPRIDNPDGTGTSAPIEYMKILRTCVISLDENLIDGANMKCAISKRSTLQMHFKLYSSFEYGGNQ